MQLGMTAGNWLQQTRAEQRKSPQFENTTLQYKNTAYLNHRLFSALKFLSYIHVNFSTIRAICHKNTDFNLTTGQLDNVMQKQSNRHGNVDWGLIMTNK